MELQEGFGRFAEVHCGLETVEEEESGGVEGEGRGEEKV